MGTTALLSNTDPGNNILPRCTHDGISTEMDLRRPTLSSRSLAVYNGLLSIRV
ncbi:hypothetical protein BDR04DRAFT_1098232 [Suillus decipiens]|nr:hypothetical protein BDR04DRAFT_1098232 [Suillus decipiens]